MERRIKHLVYGGFIISVLLIIGLFIALAI